MRLLVVICAVLLLGAVAAAMKSDTIDIDVTTIKASNERNRREAPDSGDDDDDGSTAIQADEASGSGEEPTTPLPKKSVTVTKKSKEKQTKPPTPEYIPTTTKHREESKPKKTKPTEKVVEVKRGEQVTTKAPKKEVLPTTIDESMHGGGVSENGDMSARKGQDEAVQVLTTEVIAAVVVGGVCAIILIAFLVYRLRKRDEGSYILTDNAFKDTNKLRGDTGKEAFV